MKRPLLTAIVAGAMAISVLPSAASAASYCRTNEVPSFHFGFATLKAVLGSGMGQPIDCEHGQVGGSSSVTVQNTTAGMAYYVARSNTVAFIPDLGGSPQSTHDTWALAPSGLLYFWQGNAAEPPADAVQVDPNSCDTLPQDAPSAIGVACFEFFAMSLGNPLAQPSAVSAPNPVTAPAPPAAASLQSSSPPLAPAIAQPPSEDQLRVTISQIDASLGGEFPRVTGRVCNQATTWDADEIRISFVFYDRNGFETLDDGSYTVAHVLAGDCQRFEATLTALQPWRKIGVGRITWTWQR